MGMFKSVLPVATLLALSSVVNAAIAPTEVAELPTSVNYGGGDKVGSQLIGATYNGGEGPGIWIVSDGGYRLYLNGELLAEDNQAGRVNFVPMTFLPGENALSVIATNSEGKGGVLVQIDELHQSYVSGSGWKAKPYVGDASWKNKGRNLSQWGGATVSGNAATMPSGGALSGFPSSEAQWVWTDSPNDTLAVLLFTFNIKAEGFGASTTGGEAGKIVIAKDSAEIRKHLQSNEAVTILVPEGTYDFRQFENAATAAKAKGRTWCKMACAEKNAVTGKTNTFYRIAFEANSCASLSEPTTIVQESENLQSWNNWITTKPNKSLVGMGRGANLRGASIAVRANEGSYNHIYRNLAIYDVNPHLIEAGDGLETVGNKGGTHVKNFWADHISYKWISDGMDMEFLDAATISYMDFDGANEYNCWGTDPYMALVEDAQLTYANNYWHNTYGRVPKVTGEARGSTVHIYNQYVDKNRFFIAGASGQSSSVKAEILYENSYISGGQGYLSEIGNYGYVAFSGVSYSSDTKQQYRENNVVKSGIPTASVFKPNYSYEKRTVANLPNEIPNLVGVGGRYGRMPEYNQAFGISNKAPSVSISANANGNIIEISANASDADGKISSVDFYVGITKVASSTSAPYTAKIADAAPGVYSVVAIAKDNSGLSQMSAYQTVLIEGEVKATLTKCGGGSSSQTITLGESIAPFCYTWTGASEVEWSNFPKGIEVSVDNEAKKVNISGTPEEVGVFNYIIQTKGAAVDTIINVRNITVLAPEVEEVPVDTSTTPEIPIVTIGTDALMEFRATEAVSNYRLFDMLGRPLYFGNTIPHKLPATRILVVEYNQNGTALRKYILSK